jgi:hypothetical protein
MRYLFRPLEDADSNSQGRNVPRGLRSSREVPIELDIEDLVSETAPGNDWGSTSLNKAPLMQHFSMPSIVTWSPRPNKSA